MTTRWIAAGTSAFSNAAGPARVLAQGAVPVILPPSGFFANNGVLVIGQAPSNSATVSFSATSGSVTMTFSAATLLGTASDVGRVLTILDTTYKYATITAQSSTTVATATISGGTLSGTGPFANNTIWLSGTTQTIAGTAGFSSLLGGVYPNCFMSFPAGAIAAGVPAAQTTYYAQMTTSTLVTVFNNTLATAGGIPNDAAIPASPTAFATTGPGAYSQTTGNLILTQISVAANSFGKNGRLHLRALQSNNNSGNNKTPLVQFGGTTIFSTAVTSNLLFEFERYIVCRGVTNAQVTNIGGASGLGAGAAAPLQLAIDTTAAQNLNIDGAVATATDSMQYDFLIAEIFPG